jgi:hypothetical protein
MKAWIKYALIGLLVIIVLVAYPFEITVGPDWDVHVIDENGKPLIGATVRETWQQCSLETQSHEEDKTTDSNGAVHFPVRRMMASLLSKFIGCISNFRQSGVHSSCGTWTDVFGTKCGYGWLLSDVGKTKGERWFGWSNHANATIFLRACELGHSGIECMSDADAGMKPCDDPRRPKTP